MIPKAFEIEKRSFSTDYMEWNLRSSARLKRTPGARDDREREARPDHDIATNDKTKIPATVALFSDTERQAVGSFNCEILAARKEHLRERGLREERTCSGMLGAVRMKQVCTGREAGQDDEAEGKEARAGHRGSALPAPPRHDRGCA
jgi:hypothetical protein